MLAEWGKPMLEVLAALAFASVAAIAARGYAVSRTASLRLFAGGYFLLALSLLMAATLHAMVASASTIETNRFDAFDVLFWAYYAAQVGAWVLLVKTFDRGRFRWVLAVGPVLLVAGPVLQFLVIVMAFLVVLQAGLNHIEVSRPGSFQTASGYGLLLGGAVANLYGYAPLAPRSLLGDLLTLGAAILLTWAAYPKGGR